MTIAQRWMTLVDALRSAASAGLDFLHSHLELFGVEFEQELWRARQLITRTVAAVLLACLAAGFSGFALIVLFWDSHRELAAGIVAAVFVAAAAVAIVVLKRSVDARLQPFASTLEMLERDRQALRSGK